MTTNGNVVLSHPVAPLSLSAEQVPVVHCNLNMIATDNAFDPRHCVFVARKQGNNRLIVPMRTVRDIQDHQNCEISL
jgi:hypothetical protein